MRFTLFGGVRAWSGDGPIDLGPARQRCVLAVLLVAAGRPVPIEVLIDRVWGVDPPDAVRSALYSYVARLRKVLQDSDVALTRGDAGYQVAAPDDAVDLWRWDGLLKRARTVAGDQRAKLLDQALDLHGEPLADLDGRWVEQVREAVEQQYVAALVEWADLASPDEAIKRLAEPAAGRPSAEALVAARMRALHLAGRTAEALDVFARARTQILTELGVEPGAMLRDLHLELLHADRAATGPAQLPAVVADFTGRTEVVGELDRMIDAATVVITAGTAGVGKTSLAVHWGHRVADRFPDGQMFVNLHGYGPAPPMEPARALALLLQALGVPGEEVPADVEARIGLYRTRLAGKRMLVVLDNARTAEQVRPLLPGESGCLAVVTSRDSLAGLVALDGARRIDLDVLPDGEARDLLTKLLGPSRIRAEPDATTRLAGLCARLPLALRIAAANVGSSSITAYVEKLAGNRLAGLAVDGDPHAVVATHFDHSYRTLSSAERRLFRGFGQLAGLDLTAYSAAALLAGPVDSASRLLGRLASAHLIDEHLPGRYTCHDLLRAYADQQANREDPRTGTESALRRLFDWYLHTAVLAMDQVDAHRRRLPAAPAVPATGSPPLPSYEAALEWLETERSNLLAITAIAADRGWPQTWQLPHTLWRFFYVRGHLQDWYRSHQLALESATDLLAEAETLNNLGTAFRRAGRHPQALEHHAQALDKFRQAGNPSGEVAALANVAVDHQRLGQYPDALEHHRRALVLLEGGDPRLRANVLGNLGVCYEELARYPEAQACYQHALDTFRQVGDRLGEAMCLANIGIVHQRLGEYPQALENQRYALARQRELGDRQGEAAVLANLGYTYCRMGGYADAFGNQHQALAIAEEIGDSDLASEIQNDLGETHRAAGEHRDSLDRHRWALVLAADSGRPHQEARAHHGIARALQAIGESGDEHWQRALELFTDLGMPEADELRNELP